MLNYCNLKRFQTSRRWHFHSKNGLRDRKRRHTHALRLLISSRMIVSQSSSSSSPSTVDSQRDAFWQPSLDEINIIFGDEQEREESPQIPQEVEVYKYTREELELLRKLQEIRRDKNLQLRIRFRHGSPVNKKLYDIEEDNDSNVHILTIYLHEQDQFHEKDDDLVNEPDRQYIGSDLYSILKDYHQYLGENDCRAQIQLKTKGEDIQQVWSRGGSIFVQKVEPLTEEQIKYKQQQWQWDQWLWEQIVQNQQIQNNENVKNTQSKQQQVLEGEEQDDYSLWDEFKQLDFEEVDSEQDQKGDQKGGRNIVFALKIEDGVDDDVNEVEHTETRNGDNDNDSDNVNDNDNDNKTQVSSTPLAYFKVEDDSSQHQCRPIDQLTPDQQRDYEKRLDQLYSVDDDPEQLHQYIFGASWNKWKQQVKEEQKQKQQEQERNKEESDNQNDDLDAGNLLDKDGLEENVLLDNNSDINANKQNESDKLSLAFVEPIQQSQEQEQKQAHAQTQLKGDDQQSVSTSGVKLPKFMKEMEQSPELQHKSKGRIKSIEEEHKPISEQAKETYKLSGNQIQESKYEDKVSKKQQELVQDDDCLIFIKTQENPKQYKCIPISQLPKEQQELYREKIKEGKSSPFGFWEENMQTAEMLLQAIENNMQEENQKAESIKPKTTKGRKTTTKQKSSSSDQKTIQNEEVKIDKIEDDHKNELETKASKTKKSAKVAKAKPKSKNESSNQELNETEQKVENFVPDSDEDGVKVEVIEKNTPQVRERKTSKTKTSAETQKAKAKLGNELSEQELNQIESIFESLNLNQDNDENDDKEKAKEKDTTMVLETQTSITKKSAKTRKAKAKVKNADKQNDNEEYVEEKNGEENEEIAAVKSVKQTKGSKSKSKSKTKVKDISNDENTNSSSDGEGIATDKLEEESSGEEQTTQTKKYRNQQKVQNGEPPIKLEQVWAPFSWPVQDALTAVITTKDKGNLVQAGFNTVLQVLNHYPRDYKDIRQLPEVGSDVLCKAKVLGAYNRNISSYHLEMAQWDFLIKTEEMTCKVSGAMFRRGPKAGAAIRQMMHRYKKGSIVYIKGPIKSAKDNGVIQEFQFGSTWNIVDNELVEQENLSAMYPPRRPLKSKDFKRIIPKILEKGCLDKLQGSGWDWDPLPQNIVQKHKFMSWKEAMKNVHEPISPEIYQDAAQRVAFQEFLAFQLFLLDRRNKYQMNTQKIEEEMNTKLMEKAMQHLEFELTDAQKRCLNEIIADMKGDLPLLRLLQGDVGSGKTIVAFLAVLAAVGSGYQAAIMAPTEVLANQHFIKFKEFVQTFDQDNKYLIEMLVGSTKTSDRRRIVSGLADGSVHITVGTHALITQEVDFDNLRMVVIDEQHKFGVEQRGRLSSKCKSSPHLLAMSATPIPRTLALVAHGDMALSVIDEMPKGRQLVETKVFTDNHSEREQLNAEIRSEIESGGQVFIVYPFIERSISEGFEEYKAAEEEYERIVSQKVFGENVTVALMHGRMKGDEKRNIMNQFKNKECMVLISTTVVEVGVDIPEASVMVVEHGERFGLAQLHQLRGRVGRGRRKSRCFITCNETAFERLAILAETNDGFKISEFDLVYRGSGDLLGSQQSGNDCTSLSRLAMQQIQKDGGKTLLQAKEAAFEILGNEPLQTCDPKLQSMVFAYGLMDLDIVAQLSNDADLL